MSRGPCAVPTASRHAASVDTIVFKGPGAILPDSKPMGVDALPTTDTSGTQNTEELVSPRTMPDLTLLKRQASSLEQVNAVTDIPPTEVVRPRELAANAEGTPQAAVTLQSRSWLLEDETLHHPGENNLLPRLSASAASSTGGHDEQYAFYMEQIGEGRTYLQIWVLCVLIGATLILPVGILLLSYLFTPLAKAIAGANETNSTESFQVTDKMPGLAEARLPSHCYQEPRLIDDVQNVSAYNVVKQRQGAKLDLYCLYNNSRFLTGSAYDFLPQNLPLSMCRYVVYWSIGVKDGRPVSRVPKFDSAYGLEQLRTTFDQLGVPDVKILVAVGGYPEDNTQLSLLSRHPDALTGFAGSMTDLITSYRLDGVAIHWVLSDPACEESGDEYFALQSIVAALRDGFARKGLSSLLTVIVPADEDVAHPLVELVIDFVDYVFIETQALRPSPPLAYDVCREVGSQVSSLVMSQRNYTGNEHKFCVTLSVAPWEVEASAPASSGQRPQLLNISSSSRFGGPPGVGSLSEICVGTPCLLRKEDACIGIVADESVDPLFVYLFHNATILFDMFSHQSGTPNARRCALVVDLDYDEFAELCPFVLPNTFMRHLYWALLYNQRPNYLRNYLSKCTFY
ncbi:hypothetical protein HPB50_021829 [Hyalomma asiaticum]|uniref:Uncharacterized protein n=1 Tax=Hyalomma asiaticum TaxID=266040 RepID=A0ACB7RPX7_HYAAI|nr:hypothetical protein HPB50_021829 [Hyalomma asiaticum]